MHSNSMKHLQSIIPGFESLAMPLTVDDSSGRTVGGWPSRDAAEHWSTSTRPELSEVPSACKFCHRQT